MKVFLEKLDKKQDLTFEESKAAFEILMNGKASDDEMFNFLTLLSAKGEVSNEIAGGVYVLRNKSKRVNVDNCIDTCGTGGDGKNSLNISTASALLLASMGIKVAKHGNKAVSSKCGSGDVLEKLVKYLKIKDHKTLNEKSLFSGKTIMFTGRFEKMSRSEAKSLAEENGAKILSSITKKLNYLIIGNSKPTKNKIEKAKELKIHLMTEKEWYNLLNR